MWTKLTEYAEGIVEIVAPPEDEGAAGAGNGNGLATVDVIDADEQEQYISELERALLQRKKANDTLEQRVRIATDGRYTRDEWPTVVIRVDCCCCCADT